MDLVGASQMRTVLSSPTVAYSGLDGCTARPRSPCSKWPIVMGPPCVSDLTQGEKQGRSRLL